MFPHELLEGYKLLKCKIKLKDYIIKNLHHAVCILIELPWYLLIMLLYFILGRGGTSGGKFRISLGLPVAAIMNCADNTGNLLLV